MYITKYICGRNFLEIFLEIFNRKKSSLFQNIYLYKISLDQYRSTGEIRHRDCEFKDKILISRVESDDYTTA